MMYIPIDDEDPLLAPGERHISRHGRVVEVAVAADVVQHGVVTGGTEHAEAIAEVAG